MNNAIPTNNCSLKNSYPAICKLDTKTESEKAVNAAETHAEPKLQLIAPTGWMDGEDDAYDEDNDTSSY